MIEFIDYPLAILVGPILLLMLYLYMRLIVWLQEWAKRVEREEFEKRKRRLFEEE